MSEDLSPKVRAHGVQKVSYKHEECIRLLLLDPFMTQRALAMHFGVTESWMSRVMSSDAFKAQHAEAKLELHGTAFATVSEKLEQLAHASLNKLLEKLEGPAAMPSDDLLVKATQLSTTALGYGARDRGPSGATAQVIINLPGKSENEGAWASRYARSPGGVSEAVETKAGTPPAG